jgi:hypothetical protein
MSLSFSMRRLLVASCATAAVLAAACGTTDGPTALAPRPAAPLSSKGGTGGGGGGGGTPLVVTTPPTVNATGTWVGTSDGPDVTHTYTFRLTQTAAGLVSGTGSMTTPFQSAAYTVAGTVNGDTLTLYTGPGTVSSGGSLSPLYRGVVSADGSLVDGRFLNGGVSPVTLFRQ